jgi:hypothetical protein
MPWWEHFVLTIKEHRGVTDGEDRRGSARIQKLFSPRESPAWSRTQPDRRFDISGEHAGCRMADGANFLASIHALRIWNGLRRAGGNRLMTKCRTRICLVSDRCPEVRARSTTPQYTDGSRAQWGSLASTAEAERSKDHDGCLFLEIITELG